MQLTRFVSKSNSASMATGVTALLMSGLFMSGLLMTGLLLQVGCSSGGGSGGGGGGNWPVATYDTGIATGTDGGVAADSGTAGVDAGGCPPKTCASAGANCGTMPDGCGGTLNCGQCTGGQVCGAGNICGNTPCQKQTCQQVSAACGTATDGCGGTQSCGDCSGGQACQSNQCICQPKTCQQVGATCGKVDNGCGGSIDCGVCATCELGCPQSFSCNGGACTGGNVMQLKLNMQTVPVSGIVTLNAKTPQFGQYCDKNSSSRYMRVRFVEVKKGYSFEVLRRCNSTPHNFAFETVVFPGTYKVTASGYTTGYSNLPTTQQVIYDNLTLTKPTSGITLNITTVPVSGVVTLNGKTPQFGQYCDKNSSSRYMRVRFSEVKKGYSFEVLRRCNSTPHNFAFETVVFPGTYKVSASGYTAGYSNLPTTQQVIFDTLTLTKPTSGITLNITTVPVSGIVTLNGKTPQFGQYCDKNSSSRYMRVRFSEVKKGYS
ncbi:MAG: hypothetical protein KC502_15820, partial [Myxococcales bacterium]|nr:hypothetical protein [Myxococcales bacterium]